jgi:isoleucyl-tRNA synthetase
MAKAVAEYDQGGMIHIASWDEEFDSSLFIRKSETKPDIIAADFNNGANVLALDIKLTDDLIADGAVRDLVRSCQVLRKDAGYVVEQEIALMINTDDDFILNAINDKRDHIASELLAQEVVINDSFIADMTNDVEIMDKIVTIGVRKWK